jgi:hypothetical protein
MFVTSPDKPMPPFYQKEDCQFTYRSLQAGESCSLIGIGSVGKSNLLQHLTRDEVKLQHLDKAEAPFLLTVYLDPHTLIHLSGRALEDAGELWAGYELMLSQMQRTLVYKEGSKSGVAGKGDASRVKSSGGKAENPLSSQVGQALSSLRNGDSVVRQSGIRHLEDAVYSVLADDDRWRVCFLLDEISGFSPLPAGFFQSLRGLRDQFKGRLTYITTSNTPLDSLLADLHEPARSAMKDFTDLFRDRVRYISPLDAASAAAVVDRFIARYDDSYSVHPKGKAFLNGEVFTLTGGYVGLMRRSFQPAVQYLIDGERGAILDVLLANPSVARECDTILSSLSEAERRVFYHAIHDGQIQDAAVWDQLFEKHIVKRTADGQADFQSPLLGQYALRNPEILVGSASRR